MFQADQAVKNDSIQKAFKVYRQTTILQPNDVIEIEIFTNNGEKLVDPNSEFRNTRNASNEVLKEEVPSYVVQQNGIVKLPMIGNVLLKGKTLAQTDSILATAYAKFYNEVCVITEVTSSRVVVFGPEGGKVIPLKYENSSLIEVLALYGGLGPRAKASNIRLIRGDLKNPDVQIIDLSTIEGMRKAQLTIFPNDIIYIERAKRTPGENVRDVLPIFQITTAIASLFLIFYTIKNR
jgi:polysaccharide export outer membrane protein